LLPLLAIPAHGLRQGRVCPVVARVNGEIITRQAYLAVLRDYRIDFSWPMVLHGKSQNEIDAELEHSRPSLLDDLIDELILAQRGKELGFDADVELKRLEDVIPPGYRDSIVLFGGKELIDVEQAQASRRRQALGERAIQEEVFEPIFHSITDNERRGFYDNHKEEFVLPSLVTLSEIFLPFSANSESEIAKRAGRLLAELRSGAEFLRAVAENTPASRPSYAKKGLIGTFRPDELRHDLAVDLEQLKPGEFSLQHLGDGYQVIRVDSRTPATTRSYEDPMTKDAAARLLTMERVMKTRKGYIAALRQKVTIELCPDK
jgi:parvulin-like peptidyl-prolyl isomerase